MRKIQYSNINTKNVNEKRTSIPIEFDGLLDIYIYPSAIINILNAFNLIYTCIVNFVYALIAQF